METKIYLLGKALLAEKFIKDKDISSDMTRMKSSLNKTKFLFTLVKAMRESFAEHDAVEKINEIIKSAGTIK